MIELRIMLLQNPFEILYNWLISNLLSFIISLVALLIGFIILLLAKREIRRMAKKHKLEERTAKNLIRIIKIIIYLVVFSAIISQFAESLGLITALFSLVGGTIVGFAAMNTLGNMIAGLIIFISKPLVVGNRIVYEGIMADVIEIKLIYTILEDLDGVELHIPNQKLLSEKIVNFKENGNIVRRSVKVTPGFDEDANKVEEALLEAATKVNELLEDPSPYVWINRYLDYAVEYTLYVFIDDIKNLPFIDSKLHKAVLKTVKEKGIDISTPLLLKRVE